MKIVYIKWMDTTTYSDRIPLSGAQEAELTVAETIGFFLSEDKHKIVLAHSLFHIPKSEELASEFTAIPKGWIVKRKDYD